MLKGFSFKRLPGTAQHWLLMWKGALALGFSSSVRNYLLGSKWLVLTSWHLLLKNSEQGLTPLPKWSWALHRPAEGCCETGAATWQSPGCVQQRGSSWCLVFKAHYCCFVLIVQSSSPLCFLHLAQGQRRVRFLWQRSGGRVVKWLFLGVQQNSIAQVLMSYPPRCLFEFLGGPFILWSVGKARDTFVRPWVNTVSYSEPVLHTKLSMKQNVQWFTSLKVMQARLMTDARLFAQCYQPR